MPTYSAATLNFKSRGYLADRVICYKWDLKRTGFDLARRILRGKSSKVISGRYSIRRAKDIILEEKLAIDTGRPSWFYTAYESRGAGDPLTTFALDYITAHKPKRSRVLVTGCGCGIMAFNLADQFEQVVGIDVMPECIAVANRIKNESGYANTEFYADDAFSPQLSGTFDIVTAMQWLFTAWGGSYGNPRPADAFKPEVREKALTDLLQAYAPHMNPGGFLIVELTDAVCDYRLSTDNPRVPADLDTLFPIRQSPEQVRKCAAALGMDVIEQKFSTNGHQPRTTYILQKR